MIKISEIFFSLQGEGMYAGTPMLFIRTSGCTRACEWCDTSYHKMGQDFTVKAVCKIVEKYGPKIICFTGGEPLIFSDAIKNIIYQIQSTNTEIKFHVETNGDLFQKNALVLNVFSYISVSPKDLKTAQDVYTLLKSVSKEQYDIKIVTDLDNVNMDLVRYATILMPLTTYNVKKDELIRKRVWSYCTDHKINYSPRLHYEVFGRKRKV